MFRKAFVLVILFALSFSFSGCFKNRDEVIEFDNRNPLSLAPDINWAVVNDPYAAYRIKPTWESDVAGHCRKAEILQVKGKSLDENLQSWYLFDGGWLSSDCLSIYNNWYKASAAAAKIEDK